MRNIANKSFNLPLSTALCQIKENSTEIITLAELLRKIWLKKPILQPFWISDETGSRFQNRKKNKKGTN